ncbi:MAG: 2-dehydropantoate 2-reductase [Rhodospirillales bacterium]|nr:2-dehydropantoate 2-reductase [Rhodospirillales bacterium]
MSRVLIFGAGAIGGYMGVKLAQAGADVTFFARGPHLAAMKANGIRLISEGKETVITKARFTGDPDEAGAQDFVIAALKATGLAPAAGQIAKLLGPETALVTAMNGVPYWYFYGHGGAHDGARLKSVDPDGRLWSTLDPARAIGCIVYPAANILEPGVIEHTYSNRFALGEPDGSKSARIQKLADLMIAGGLKAPIRPRIRDDMWVKLWGNLTFNPVSALTGATLEAIASDPGTRAVAKAMMLEAQAVGEALGIRFGIDVEKRIDGAGEVGAHKTSMLQDLEARKPMEIDAMLGAVVEMGELVGHAMPACRIVLSLVRQRAHVAGVYP